MNAYTTDLVEYFVQGYALAEAHVNRESGVISNVALLGAVSANNRHYSESAMRDAARLYTGVRMFIDHPTDRDLRDRKGTRSIRDMCGKVLSARLVGGLVRGDIQIVGPHKDMIFDIAESMPELIGHSHRAKGRVKPDGSGGMVVESLESVQAVELVTEPATTNGLFESVEDQTTTEGDTEVRELQELREQNERLEFENYKLRSVADANLSARVKTKVFVDLLEAADTRTKVDILIADRRDLTKLLAGLRGSLLATPLDESRIGEYADRLFDVKPTSVDESRIGDIDKQLFG